MTTSDAGEFNQMMPIPPSPPPKRDVDDATLPSLGLHFPLSPISPSSLTPLTEKTRKYSPLTDLIESEKAYVELLTGIIRKVAAAWSRSNLPPQELDVVFRSVEGVYKTNRILVAKLKEIGENPSSPKALGDLLMRWIDDLEQPYRIYADCYCIGFDDWEPVKSNTKLPGVLRTFSSTNPPTSSLLPPTHLLDSSLWTLDTLFSLPKGRLQYYRKLYNRLLKSTTPGRSDHRLLTGALEKLDGLLVTLDDRASINVGISVTPQIALPLQVTEPVAMDPAKSEPVENGPLLPGKFGVESASAAASTRGSFSSRDERLSQETALTSLSGKSYQTIPMHILDLEKRLVTEKTLDIFTMQPKQIRLQIVPPTLSYTRELRLSARVLVRFTPRATGVEVIHRHGYVYVLSDLFLLCEQISREERVARGDDGQDMHLCYPPLSGKVLDATEVPGHASSLRVCIMRKETLILEADSQLKRDRILNEFQECISFAKTISRAAQEPAPPMPAVGDLLSRSTHLGASGHPPKKRPDRALNPRLLPQSQPSNVHSGWIDGPAAITREILMASSTERRDGLPAKQPRPVLTRLEVSQGRHDTVGDFSSNPTSPINVQEPTLHSPGSMHPPNECSAGYTTNSPPSFAPGQFVPPVRRASIQSRSSPFVAPPSDFSNRSEAQNPAPQNSVLRHHASMRSLRQESLQHQPSLRSLPSKSNHHGFTVPHPQPVPGQPTPVHPPNLPAISYPMEQSSNKLKKSLSSRSLHTQYQPNQNPLPPVPSLPDGLPMPRRRPYSQQKDSVVSPTTPTSGPLLLPSVQMGPRCNSVVQPSISDPSPPMSPVDERKQLGPVRSVITAQMKCKVFHQQQHAQWKSLGSASLTLYRQEPTNVKQLVVEASNKEKSILISTIVLTDGVERVGKTGVAIELSDASGSRTGVIYMIQLRNEDSASGIFKSLLEGSDRAT